jgi:hypothetical protein
MGGPFARRAVASSLARERDHIPLAAARAEGTAEPEAEDAAREIAALRAEVVRGHGGAGGFARAWITCLRGALPRGGFAALRHLEATIQLIQHCEQT